MTRKTMLYVEDEADDVFFMRHALKKLGGELELRSVGDVRSAIAYLEGREEGADGGMHPVPDLILVDLNLPVMSGFDLIQWIRGEHRFDRLPIVVFSSSGRAEDRERARSLGADGYLTKPSSGAELQTVVREILARWLSSTPLNSRE